MTSQATLSRVRSGRPGRGVELAAGSTGGPSVSSRSAQEKHEEAEPLLRECLEIREQALPAEHWLRANTRSVLGELVARQGRYEGAEPLVVGAWEALADHPDASDERKRQALERVVRLYADWGRPEDESRWRDVLANLP